MPFGTLQSDAPSADRRRRKVEKGTPIDLEGGALARLVMSLDEEIYEAANVDYAARLRDQANEFKRELRA